MVVVGGEGCEGRGLSSGVGWGGGLRKQRIYIKSENIMTEMPLRKEEKSGKKGRTFLYEAFNKKMLYLYNI